MSKKTKKQKILADLRRKMQKLDVAPRETETRTSSLVSHYSLPVSSPVSYYSQPLSHSQNDSLDYSYVISDLRRIIILTALAICAQIVLWYMLGRG